MHHFEFIVHNQLPDGVYADVLDISLSVVHGFWEL
jgi:hypothetical protein